MVLGHQTRIAPILCPGSLSLGRFSLVRYDNLHLHTVHTEYNPSGPTKTSLGSFWADLSGIVPKCPEPKSAPDYILHTVQIPFNCIIYTKRMQPDTSCNSDSHGILLILYGARFPREKSAGFVALAQHITKNLRLYARRSQSNSSRSEP